MKGKSQYKPLIIFGTGSISQVVSEYVMYAGFNVCGYTKTGDCIRKGEHLVIPFEEIQDKLNPKDYLMYVAIGDNNIREKYMFESSNKGFDTDCSFTFSDMWAIQTKNKVNIGFHNFVFENNTIQPFVSIGNNNVIWSHNHIGHHSTIGDNNFISSMCCISGHCTIGNNNFLGVNCTLIENVTIGDNCLIAAGAIVLADVPDNTKVIGVWKNKRG